ncbi:MAG TPA: leucyl/phenylalanyl-tRNA--protein transferase [Micavibrio sp.]|nr:leucyl/phenylalanyl-tRNA--protein transferase [Micavibrio sp.]HIL28113.1 leucyl/phenylalanyl-tRNA--protein transferase [Micavibrio sp.]
MSEEITIADVLNGYACGLFPMADSRTSPEFHWYDPPMRGQLSISALHIPKKLLKTVRQAPYDIRIDTAFEDVIDGCAETAADRPETWINQGIRDLFVALHRAGFARSVEAWDGDKLVGGLYGLAIGGAFMGESMFSRADDASKVALVHLCARLWKGGYSILDTQFTNPHLEQFGIYEVSRNEYRAILAQCLYDQPDFQLENISESALVNDYLQNRTSK